MSKHLKLFLLCAPLAASVFFTPLMANAEELTLDRAVARGVISNPEYGVVANNRMATQEELEQGEGLYLPSIDLRGSGGVSWSDNSITSGVANRDETRNIYDYSATLTQMLFDGFTASGEVTRQGSRVKSASYRVEETAQLVGLSIVESYLEVMRQRDLLQIAKDNVREHMGTLNEIRSGTQAGRSTEADVSQAEARLSNARATESNVRESLRVAESQFQRNAGQKPDILIMPNVPTEQLQPNVDEAVKVAMTGSPTLGIYEADAAVAWSEYQNSAAAFYPKLDLQLQGRQTNDLDNSVPSVDKSASAQLIANWNVFRGGIDKHLRRETAYRHAQAKEARAQQSRIVEDDLRQTWASMVASGERAKAFNEQADSNSKVVGAYKDQFELDRRTLLDVLDSQNELFVSRSNAINAQYLEILAVYRILALEGRLLPTLGVPSPREASLETKIK